MSVSQKVGDPPNDIEPIELRCPACDYDLRALAGDRCPECGLLVDRQRLSVSRIPWVHRAQIGRVRAYCRTVMLAWRHPFALAQNVAMPVELRDAKRFQRVTVFLAYFPLLVVGVGALIANNNTRFDRFDLTHGPQKTGYILQLLLYLVIAGSGWLFLLTATGVASYFFHPKSLSVSRQNRAIAISYYACAPLSTLVLTLLLLGGAALVNQYCKQNPLGSSWLEPAVPGLEIVAGLLAMLQIGGWVFTTLVLLKRSTVCGATRLAALGAGLPVCWAILAALFLGVLPMSFLLIFLMILSW